MTTSNQILLEHQSSKENTPIISNYTMPKCLFLLNGYFESALRTIRVVIVIAFLSVLSSAAFGANPAEELAKHGTTGGIDQAIDCTKLRPSDRKLS